MSAVGVFEVLMPGFDDLDDRDLLVAALSDVDAFGVFYRRHAGPLVRFFYRSVGGADVALDLTAETFATVLVELPRFRPSGAPATAWLYAIARNLLMNSLRRGYAEARARSRLEMAPLELTDDGLATIERIIADTEQPALALVEELPTEQRDAIKAHVIDGRGYRELAVELRCSEQVVRKRVSRGLETLRRELGGGK